ncbi:MAG: metallophosphoesterase family protein [Candidatus Omnitrophota bacterium]|nr:metallophosphatase family protein [Candidatus Omnitrophota bacterium]
MRYGIFSDIHSNLEGLTSVIQAYQKEGIGQYICIGDLVGYAADPNECVSLVKELEAVTVAGNHDWASVGLLSSGNFNFAAQEAVIYTQEKLNPESKEYLKSLQLVYKNQDFILAHGTLANPEYFNYMLDRDAARSTFKLMEGKVIFVGHSHVPGFFNQNPAGDIAYQEADKLDLSQAGKYIVNVGSVGQPRDGDPRACYCIYDSERMIVEIKRASYDIEKARDKIIQADLPSYLGQRLLCGV